MRNINYILVIALILATIANRGSYAASALGLGLLSLEGFLRYLEAKGIKALNEEIEQRILKSNEELKARVSKVESAVTFSGMKR